MLIVSFVFAAQIEEALKSLQGSDEDQIEKQKMLVNTILEMLENRQMLRFHYRIQVWKILQFYEVFDLKKPKKSPNLIFPCP